MEPPGFIDLIAARLAHLPEGRVERDEGRIYVLPEDETGFTVLIFLENKVYTVYANGWHGEYDTEGEAVTTFFYALSERCRLQEVQRGDEAYHWTLEWQEKGGWKTISATAILLAPVWRRKRTVTLQNRTIPVDAL